MRDLCEEFTAAGIMPFRQNWGSRLLEWNNTTTIVCLNPKKIPSKSPRFIYFKLLLVRDALNYLLCSTDATLEEIKEHANFLLGPIKEQESERARMMVTGPRLNRVFHAKYSNAPLPECVVPPKKRQT